jgi:hypothetical protein
LLTYTKPSGSSAQISRVKNKINRYNNVRYISTKIRKTYKITFIQKMALYLQTVNYNN